MWLSQVSPSPQPQALPTLPGRFYSLSLISSWASLVSEGLSMTIHLRTGRKTEYASELIKTKLSEKWGRLTPSLPTHIAVHFHCEPRHRGSPHCSPFDTVAPQHCSSPHCVHTLQPPTLQFPTLWPPDTAAPSTVSPHTAVYLTLQSPDTAAPPTVPPHCDSPHFGPPHTAPTPSHCVPTVTPLLWRTPTLQPTPHFGPLH